MAGSLITSRIGTVSGRWGARPADHVLPREDAERPRLGVDDRHRADPVFLHRGQRVAEQRIGAAHHRHLPQQRASGSKPALLRGGGRVFRLQSNPRQVEQVREPARAEVLEDRRRADHRVEDGDGKLEAERILRRTVDAGDAAPPDQRAQRKHLAGRELPQRDGGAADAWALATDGALADHVAVPWPLGGRCQDDLARREVLELRRADDPVEVALVHRGERRVRLQCLPHASQDRRRGDG
jgi:hypothetical protein